MRPLVHRLVLRPVMRWLTGVDVDRPDRLPDTGPAIVVANHNSHVDTALLLAAFPSSAVGRVRPAAAADYWFRGRLMRWFSRRVLGAVAIDRSGGDGDPLAEASAALGSGDIVLMYPEGTRGEPGLMGPFRSGVARLAAQHPGAMVVPVWLEGCDRVMPRHCHRPRRWKCSVRVGEPVHLVGSDPRSDARVVRRQVAALA